MIKEYSPNIEWGKQKVEIVLMQWGYKGKFAVEVGGNCRGMSVIDCAISILYESFLPKEGDDDAPCRFELKNRKGGKLLCADDEDRGDDYIKNMVVSAQIVGWTPPTINQVRKMNGAKPVKDGNRPWRAI